MQIGRRLFVGGALAAGVGAPAILRAQQLFVDYPFILGVAAGDPAPDGFVIWTRLAPDPLSEHGGMPLAPLSVDWEVGSDRTFRTIVAKGQATARPELAHSVHVEVTGLQPARPYWYRFNVGGERSASGMAKTLPPFGARLDRLRLGVAGCQNYEHGWYTAYRHLAAEPELDAVYHYGDYIYEDRQHPIVFSRDRAIRPFVRAYAGGETFSLGDYRRRYAQIKTDPDLQAAHQAAAWWVTFDDHEVQDNWAGPYDKRHTPPEIFALRRAAAFQAWYEHMPLRASALPSGSSIQSYRRARYGNLLDMHLLDTRQYRTDQPCDDEFKPVCPAVSDPKAQMIGDAQERWLAQGLRGGARWNAIAQQVMMMPLNRRSGDQQGTYLNMDSWGGYRVPRDRVIDLFRGLGNVVVLTGDEHMNYAGELRTNNGQGDTVAVEFVSTSITSDGDGSDKLAAMEDILAGNSCLKFYNYQRGYLVCDVTADSWQTRHRVVELVSQPGAPIRTRATITVPHGKPELAIG